jgi:hypothetical protein
VKYELGYIPEDGILHRHRRENLKSYNLITWLVIGPRNEGREMAAEYLQADPPPKDCCRLSARFVLSDSFWMRKGYRLYGVQGSCHGVLYFPWVTEDNQRNFGERSLWHGRDLEWSHPEQETRELGLRQILGNWLAIMQRSGRSRILFPMRAQYLSILLWLLDRLGLKQKWVRYLSKFTS